MKVRALYRPEVVSADPDEALADAAGRMQYQEIGSVAVMEHGRLIGILTERDLARALADGIDPFETPVRSYMTEEPLLTVTPETDAGKVAATMLEQGVRHLPVLEGGQVIGMVSARDLLSLEAWNTIGAR
jgi:CBS domain-containing protein